MTLRVRAKVCPVGEKQFLIVHVAEDAGKIHARAMRDEVDFPIELTVDEWNALPFHWFADIGESPLLGEKLPNERNPDG